MLQALVLAVCLSQPADNVVLPLSLPADEVSLPFTPSEEPVEKKDLAVVLESLAKKGPFVIWVNQPERKTGFDSIRIDTYFEDSKPAIVLAVKNASNKLKYWKIASDSDNQYIREAIDLYQQLRRGELKSR